MPLHTELISIESKKFISILGESLPAEYQEDFRKFAKLLEYSCHYKFQKLLNQLYASYKGFNPNADALVNLDEIEEYTYAKSLIEQFKKFLEKSQFQQISEYDICDILYFYQGRLKVDFASEKYQEFLVYFHGEAAQTHYYRSLRTLGLKKHARQMPYYEKLVVLFRPFRNVLRKPKAQKRNQTEILLDIRDISMPQPITIKLFQNIPYNYLPLTLPGVFFKVPFGEKLFLLGVAILTAVSGITASAFSLWYSLVALLPLSLLIYKLYGYTREREQSYRSLFSYCYYNNISNNKCVFRHIIEQEEEDIYKKIALVFHALWRKNSWVFGDISQESLQAYLESYLLDYCGIRSQFDLESILVECGNLFEKSTPMLPQLLNIKTDNRSYLKGSAQERERHVDVEMKDLALPRAGILEIAPGTERYEKNVFWRQDYLLHMPPPGLKFSHASGAPIRWISEKPYHTKLAIDCPAGSTYLVVPQEDIDKLPLQGLGKVKAGEGSFEFRYYRHRNSNKLFLTAGLRYRHVPSPQAPVLVRPVLPYFKLTDKLESWSRSIPMPADISFPPHGLVRLASGSDKDFVTEYSIQQSEESSFLKLAERTPNSYKANTLVSFTPPITFLRSNVGKGKWKIPVKETKNFSKRGIIILSPSKDHEERIHFYREALLLELDEPLQYAHRKGTFVEVEKINKSKIIRHVKKNAQFVMLHGFGEDIKQGSIAIAPGQNDQEIRNFWIREKYFYLGLPTRSNHKNEAEVWEANFESPLRYEAHQGNHFITVEDATSFPLQGTLEIHFNGNGVKEVFPFQRTQCSNTLLLTTHTQKLLPENSPVLITAVEITTEKDVHYHDCTIAADFSCVPDFPEHGKILIEPGTRSEEIVEFQRYKNRFYLFNSLKFQHSKGTAIDLSAYAQTTLSEPLDKNVDRISVVYAPLLPERGRLQIRDGDESEIIWYRKIPYRVLLENPCHFPHNRASCILLPGINDNVALEDSVDKGAQKIAILNAQELPHKGKIVIEGIFRSILVEFVRNGNTLYLKTPLSYGFSKRATVRLPEIFLYSHLSPGDDYFEVSDPGLLPQSGEVIFEKAYLNKMYKQKKRREERIGFRYCPNILWLDTPLRKSYPAGTLIISPELFVKGAGKFQVKPLANTVNDLNQLLTEQFTLKR